MNPLTPPQLVDTEVFARVPDRLRRKGRCHWGDVNNGGRETACFLEGPVFDRHGNLYLTDIPYGRIFRIDPRGDFEVVTEYDGQPNGMKFHRDGRLFITDYRRGILTLDPRTGKVDDYLVTRHSESFRGVNDLYFADNGDLYFTDQGQTGLQDPTGKVYRCTPEGRVTMLLDKVPSPNGITLNGAQNLLLVAVTRGNAIWRAPIMEDGSLSKVGLFVQMSGGVGPDGMAMDEADSVAVAHAGLGGAWLYSRQGLPLAFVRSCAGEFTTNLAYGGHERRDLYIVESGSGTILRARMDVPGRRHLSDTE